MPIFLYLLLFSPLGETYQLTEYLEPDNCNSTSHLDSGLPSCKRLKCENDSLTQYNDKLKIYECIKCGISSKSSDLSFMCSIKTLICNKYDYKGNAMLQLTSTSTFN